MDTGLKESFTIISWSTAMSSLKEFYNFIVNTTINLEKENFEWIPKHFEKKKWSSTCEGVFQSFYNGLSANNTFIGLLKRKKAKLDCINIDERDLFLKQVHALTIILLEIKKKLGEEGYKIDKGVFDWINLLHKK